MEIKIKKFICRLIKVLVVILVVISLVLGIYSVHSYLNEAKMYKDVFKRNKESFEGLAERMIKLKVEHDASTVFISDYYAKPPYFYITKDLGAVNKPKVYLTEDEIQWQKNLMKQDLVRIAYDSNENIIFQSDLNYEWYVYVVDGKSVKLLTSQEDLLQGIPNYKLKDNWYGFGYLSH